MTAAVGMIADLNDALTDCGEDVELRRYTQGPNGARVPFSATVRAFVRTYAPEELVAGISQQDAKVILSPTEIAASGWPGPTATVAAGDRNLPKKGDTFIIRGIPRTVEATAPFYIGDTLVRIECRVLGGPLP